MISAESLTKLGLTVKTVTEISTDLSQFNNKYEFNSLRNTALPEDYFLTLRRCRT